MPAAREDTPRKFAFIQRGYEMRVEADPGDLAAEQFKHRVARVSGFKRCR
jgi:hypothetical protein